MTFGSDFENHRAQTVRLPAGTRFPAKANKVKVRALRRDRILSPIEHAWDSFFLAKDVEDINIERGKQGAEQVRKPLE